MFADTTLIINIRINTQTTDQNLYIKVNYTTIGINTQGTLYLLCNTAVPKHSELYKTYTHATSSNHTACHVKLFIT